MTEPYVPERGDLVWLNFNSQAGDEQAGRGPALVLSRSSYNRSSGLAIVCPITRIAKGYPFEVPLPEGGSVTGVVLADHLRSVDWQARRADPAGQADRPHPPPDPGPRHHHRHHTIRRPDPLAHNSKIRPENTPPTEVDPGVATPRVTPPARTRPSSRSRWPCRTTHTPPVAAASPAGSNGPTYGLRCP